MDKLPISNAQIQGLIRLAKEYRANAYAPYSKFAVGSALLTKGGKLYGGANVENVSYPVGICAERVAISSAVASGEREFIAIAIVADTKDACPPCGMCRQMMLEFPTDIIIMANMSGTVKIITIDELMPYSFSLSK